MNYFYDLDNIRSFFFMCFHFIFIVKQSDILYNCKYICQNCQIEVWSYIAWTAFRNSQLNYAPITSYVTNIIWVSTHKMYVQLIETEMQLKESKTSWPKIKLRSKFTGTLNWTTLEETDIRDILKISHANIEGNKLYIVLAF